MSQAQAPRATVIHPSLVATNPFSLRYPVDVRSLPSIDTLLTDPRIGALGLKLRRDLLVRVVRRQVEAARRTILSRGLSSGDDADEGRRGNGLGDTAGDGALERRGGIGTALPRTHGQTAEFGRTYWTERLAAAVEEEVAAILSSSLRRAINATGIILHTGLGRAPLADRAIEAVNLAADGYCNLEIDLHSGERGSRTSHVERLLCDLTGAEAAIVVNNNAAAVLLTLNTLSLGREAIVSRGQLVEIGGSFRIPDIMSRSGAVMVEVGTTNRTHLSDYEGAISDRTGLLLAVHPSNYRVTGFVSDVRLDSLVGLASRAGIPLAHDLGGGVLIDLRRFGLPYEPVVRESIEAGVDVVTFSGDKVLGGPQAGVIVGKRRHIDLISRNPLARALRCDKLTYAALEATLRLFLDESTLLEHHPTLRMMTDDLQALEARGERILSAFELLAGAEAEGESLRDSALQSAGDLTFSFVTSRAQAGSGALPLEDIPSLAIAVVSASRSADTLSRVVRANEPPIVGYVHNDTLLLDLRTIRDDEVEIVAGALGRLASAQVDYR